MSIIEKIKLILRARKPATDMINQVTAIKKGWKTPGFWITTLTTGVGLIAALKGVVPATAVLIGTTALTAGYTVLRGLYKSDQPGVKPIWSSSETWLVILVPLANAFTELQTGGVSAPWLVAASTVLSGAIALARDLANVQPKPEPEPASPAN